MDDFRFIQRRTNAGWSAPDRITFRDIEAFCAVYDVSLSIAEIDLHFELDDLLHHVIFEVREKERRADRLNTKQKA